MRSLASLVMIVTIVGLLAAESSEAGRQKEINRTFDKKETVSLETVSGDCIVQQGGGDKIEVQLHYSYRPADSYEPRFVERKRTLVLSEEMYGSNSGRSTWILTVPKDTRIKFSSASGGLTAEEYTGEIDVETASGSISILASQGEFDLETASGRIEIADVEGDLSVDVASGDITVENSKGEMDLSTASGDVRLLSCSGQIEAGTASGDIEADRVTGVLELGAASGDVEAVGMTLEGPSQFEAASGNVYVELAATPEYDLIVSSASSDAVLSYGGNPVRGRVQLVARADRGDISAPFDFDDVEEFWRWDHEYVSKSFTMGDDAPDILIETASGRAVLKKD